MPTRFSSRLDLAIAAALAGFGLSSVFFRKRPAGVTEPAATADETVVNWHRELNIHGSNTAEPDQAEAKPRPTAWAVASQVFWKFNDHRIMSEAAGVTFYALLALFPALAALISLYGLIATPASLSDELNAANGLVPGGGMDIIHEQLKNLTHTNGGALSIGAIVGPLTALWSANSGTKSLFDALNVVYGEKEQRSFICRTMVSLAVTIGAMILLLIAMTTLVVLPIVLTDVGLTDISANLLSVLRWPLLFAMITILLDVLYRFGPSRTEAQWRWITWGGAISAIVWIIISLLFSWYVANFNSFNKTYGSLGAAIAFMTWIWISSMVVLAGAELDATLEQAKPAAKTAIRSKPA